MRDKQTKGKMERGTDAGRAELKNGGSSKRGEQRRNGWQKQWTKRGMERERDGQSEQQTDVIKDGEGMDRGKEKR